jgi:hypothetical protein
MTIKALGWIIWIPESKVAILPWILESRSQLGIDYEKKSRGMVTMLLGFRVITLLAFKPLLNWLMGTLNLSKHLPVHFFLCAISGLTRSKPF